MKIKKKNLPTPCLSLLWSWGCEHFNLTVFNEDTHCLIAIGFSGILTNMFWLELKKTWCGWWLLITNSSFSRVWEKTIKKKKFHQWYILCKVLSQGYYQRLLPGRCTCLGIQTLCYRSTFSHLRWVHLFIKPWKIPRHKEPQLAPIPNKDVHSTTFYRAPL